MKVLDIVNGDWAITESMLIQIRDIYHRHVLNEKIDLTEISHRIQKPLENNDHGFSVVGSTAIIPIQGTIAKKMNLFHSISGGVSTELIAKNLDEVINDSAIDSIIFDIDSPGGTVEGTFELADLIFKHRDKKRMVAFSDGIMASGAMLLGAAVGDIFISSETVNTGSIGVITSHVDISKAEERAGIKTTIITAGKLKAIGNHFEPLSSEARSEIQARLDFLYGIFISKIAEFRGTTADKVLNKMADGQIFTGSQGIDAGLIDGIRTFEDLLEEVKTNKINSRGVISMSNKMSYEKFKSENAEEAKLAEESIAENVSEKYCASISEKDKEIEAAAKMNAELNKSHAELIKENEELKATIKDKDKTLVKIQAGANTKKAGCIFKDAVTAADLGKKVEAKLGEYQPGTDNYLDENGDLIEADYEVAVGKEVDTWKDMDKENKQAMGHSSEKDLIGDPADKAKFADDDFLR